MLAFRKYIIMIKLSNIVAAMATSVCRRTSFWGYYFCCSTRRDTGYVYWHHIANMKIWKLSNPSNILHKYDNSHYKHKCKISCGWTNHRLSYSSKRVGSTYPISIKLLILRKSNISSKKWHFLETFVHNIYFLCYKQKFRVFFNVNISLPNISLP